MTLRFEAVAFAVADPRSAADFWAGVLAREVREDRDEAGSGESFLVPGDDTQVGLRFFAATTPQLQSWLHLHLTSASPDGQLETVTAAVKHGGRRRGTKPLPLGRDIYLADPAGNEFCLIEPGSRFLEGTGLLGEVTCDGARDVGLFWRDALEWPLVWDEDGETAVQSPGGGTKLSWDGSPSVVNGLTALQRFDLVTPDLEADVARLVALGAEVRQVTAQGAVLTDPGGFAFRVTSARP